MMRPHCPWFTFTSEDETLIFAPCRRNCWANCLAEVLSRRSGCRGLNSPKANNELIDAGMIRMRHSVTRARGIHLTDVYLYPNGAACNCNSGHTVLPSEPAGDMKARFRVYCTNLNFELKNIFCCIVLYGPPDPESMHFSREVCFYTIRTRPSCQPSGCITICIQKLPLIILRMLKSRKNICWQRYT